MTETVEGAGVALAARARGAGAPILLVHDLAADMRAWEPLVAALGDDARTLAFDRRGYGASGAPEPYERTTVQEQAEDARAVLDALGNGAMGAARHGDADDGDGLPHRDALAVGRGFGALIVLDLLVRLPRLLRGAVLVEPPVHQFSLEATAVLSTQRELLELALREGGPAAAVEAWNPDADAEVRAAHGAFFADFAGLASLPLTRRELRAVAVPVALVTGGATPPHIVAAADALAALLPQADRRTDGDVEAALRALL